MLYKFGPFQFHADRAALLKGGEEIALRPLVAKALQFFLDHQNQTLSKEVILAHLWPDTNIQDQNLTLCLSELRKALGDNPQKPIFIKTIHKTGYRWIYRNKVKSKRAALFLAVGIGLLAILSWKLWHIKPVSEAKMPTRIALLPFENLTGDSHLKWVELGLRDVVAEASSASISLELIPIERVLKAQTNPKSSIASQLGASWVIQTQVQQEAGTFKAHLTFSGQTVNAKTVVQHPEIMGLAHEIGKAIHKRARPGQPTDFLTQTFHQNPAINIQYASGMQVFRTDGPHAAVPFFQKCIEASPDYLMAHYQLSKCYQYTGQAEEAQKILKYVLEHQNIRENPLVEAAANFQLSIFDFQNGNIQGAKSRLQTCQIIYEMHHEYSNAAIAQGQMGYMSILEQDYDEAERLLTSCLKEMQRLGNRMGEAEAWNTIAGIYDARSEYSPLKNALSEALELFSDLQMDIGIFLILSNQAVYAFDYGEFELASQKLDLCIAHFEETGDQFGLCRMKLVQSKLLATQGQFEKALQILEESLNLANALQHGMLEAELTLLKMRIFADWRGEILDLEATEEMILALNHDPLTFLWQMTKAYVLTKVNLQNEAYQALAQMDPKTHNEKVIARFCAGLLAFHSDTHQEAEIHFRWVQEQMEGDWKAFFENYISAATNQTPLPEIGFYWIK